MDLILEHVSSKYGAPMGRPNVLPADPSASVRLHLRKLDMVDGDYDGGGAYWGGGGDPIRVAYDETVLVFVRTRTRYAAKAEVLKLIPGARFYR